MEIWQFNDPEPLRPFLRILENHAPHLVHSAGHLLGTDPAPRRATTGGGTDFSYR